MACLETKEPCDLSIQPYKKAVYSGPNNCGFCICGHSWEQHHLGIVIELKRLWTDADIPEFYFPQECEAYGVNEFGDLDNEGNYHCSSYVDSHKVLQQD